MRRYDWNSGRDVLRAARTSLGGVSEAEAGAEGGRGFGGNCVRLDLEERVLFHDGGEDG